MRCRYGHATAAFAIESHDTEPLDHEPSIPVSTDVVFDLICSIFVVVGVLSGTEVAAASTVHIA